MRLSASTKLPPATPFSDKPALLRQTIEGFCPRVYVNGTFVIYSKESHQDGHRCRLMSLPLIATLILVFFTVAFSLQNDQTVSITFFKWTFEGSLVLVLLTTLCLGIVIHILVSMPARIRKSQKIAELNRTGDGIGRDPTIRCFPFTASPDTVAPLIPSGPDTPPWLEKRLRNL